MKMLSKFFNLFLAFWINHSIIKGNNISHHIQFIRLKEAYINIGQITESMILQLIDTILIKINTS